jgi:hypothetical protein
MPRLVWPALFLAVAVTTTAAQPKGASVCLALRWSRDPDNGELPSRICLLPERSSTYSLNHGPVRPPWRALWYTSTDTIDGAYFGLPVEAGAQADTLVLFTFQPELVPGFSLVGGGDSMLGVANRLRRTATGEPDTISVVARRIPPH